MAQKYRIYINEKVVLITESVPKKVEHYLRVDAATFNLVSFYNAFNGKPGCKFFYVLSDNAKDFMKGVMKSITLVEAAGGMAVNTKGEYLFIFRNGKWDLPKGKLEKGEGKKEGAVREVEEECGIKISGIGERICKTYHTYTMKGEVVLKKTYWYLMSYNGAEKLKPQREEGITKVRWFKKGHIEAIVDNTFPSIMDVLAKLDMFTDTPMPLSE